MTNLKEDIAKGSQWISSALKASGYNADFSANSLAEVERFFNENSKDGSPVPTGLLSEDVGNRLFSLGSYVGEVIRRSSGGEWITDDSDHQGEMSVVLKTSDGTIIWPMQRMMRRLKNGAEDSIIDYGVSLGLKIEAPKH